MSEHTNYLTGEPLNPRSTCVSRAHQQWDCMRHWSWDKRFVWTRWCEPCQKTTADWNQAHQAPKVVSKAKEGISERTTRPAGPKGRPCGCGCGQTTGGGQFKPGHDSRLLSQLATEINAGTLTLDAASTQLSPALAAKLAKRVTT